MDSDSESIVSSSVGTSGVRVCNTCLIEKPMTSFKKNGNRKDGSTYRTRKCLACLKGKVNPAGDDDTLRKMKIEAVKKALGVSERAMEIIAEL